MKVNADELNKLYTEILKEVDGDNTKATLLINTLGDNKKVKFFKKSRAGKLILKGHNDKLYYFSGNGKASKLDNLTLSKFDITYETLQYMRYHLGDSFRPMYLNVNDLYYIANKTYDTIKTQWPSSSKHSNMLRSINFVKTCGNNNCNLFKDNNGSRLSIKVYDGRIYQHVIPADTKEIECIKKPGEEMFISNSVLKKFPLTKEGEQFISYCLNIDKHNLELCL